MSTKKNTDRKHVIRVNLNTAGTPLAAKTVSVMARKLRERGIELAESGSDGADVVLELRAGIGVEGFAIERASDGKAWRIAGNDERGLLYGVGKFLRGCVFGSDAQNAQGWRYDGGELTSVPKLKVRGMYFASHFHNFYHDAPIAQVERYVEDLALWGCNTLSVWFDMHHYSGIYDQDAEAMIERLHAILKAAAEVGMGAGLTTLANEAYNTSPERLRAERHPHSYGVEICPSKPEGLALILQWRREMLQKFADLPVEYYWLWPYDQGGCKCANCKPWGGNGFVRTCAAVSPIAREFFPSAKMVVSAWEFGYWEGDPEWDMFYAALAKQPEWADYIMAEGHGDFPPYIIKNGPPPSYPLLNFTEISMFGMYPWGGFGANLQTQRIQKVWDSSKNMLAGGFPYSEGIFEDINKIACLQLYWDPDRSVNDIVREYASAEFSPKVADDVTRAAALLEVNMKHNIVSFERIAALRNKPASSPERKEKLYNMENVRSPEVPFGLLDSAAKQMPEEAAKSWRWRMLWLRAALDLELTRSGGTPTEKADDYFEEICRISCAENAENMVCMPAARKMG